MKEIKIGSIYKHLNNNTYADKSYKVDYYIRTKDNSNLFIEFKTDSNSRRDKQDAYLNASKNVGMNEIIDGILKIYKVTSYKKKYKFLLTVFFVFGLLCAATQNPKDDFELKVFLLHSMIDHYYHRLS